MLGARSRAPRAASQPLPTGPSRPGPACSSSVAPSKLHRVWQPPGPWVPLCPPAGPKEPPCSLGCAVSPHGWISFTCWTTQREPRVKAAFSPKRLLCKRVSKALANQYKLRPSRTERVTHETSHSNVLGSPHRVSTGVCGAGPPVEASWGQGSWPSLWVLQTGAWRSCPIAPFPRPYTLHFLCSLRPVSSWFVSPMRVSPMTASTLVHHGVPGAPSLQVLSPARGNGCLSAPHSSPCSPSPAPELYLQRLSSPPHLYSGLSPGGTTVPWP